MIQPANAWDRWPGETDTQYRQFLTYLRLGPGRTRAQAWEVYCSEVLEVEQAPESPAGAFTKAMRDFQWTKRAVAWDFDQLGDVYLEIGRDYLRGVRAVAEKAAQAAEDRDIDDPVMPGILEALAFVGKHLEPLAAAGRLTTPTPVPAVAHAGPGQAALPSGPADRAAVE